MTPEESKAIVGKLFEKFALRWARVFLQEYEGLNINTVKAEWAEELQRLTVEQTRHGYEGCKYNQYPPSLPTFLAVCKSASVPPPKQIKEDYFTPEQLARNKVRIREILNNMTRKMRVGD